MFLWNARARTTQVEATSNRPFPAQVLWELATREEVYAALSAAQIISRVANEGMRPPTPANCPWGDLMEACWAEDPIDRPGFDAIFAELSRIHEDLTGDAVALAPIELQPARGRGRSGRSRSRGGTNSSRSTNSARSSLRSGRNSGTAQQAAPPDSLLSSAIRSMLPNAQAPARAAAPAYGAADGPLGPASEQVGSRASGR